MISPKTLVVIPTYNEAENVEKLTSEILQHEGLDLLYIDDNSPDGTGRLIERIARQNSRVKLISHPCKQGIGKAHQSGIAKAYELGYDVLITMDSDFTHKPGDIPRLLTSLTSSHVSIGSRYLERGSLSSWVWYRRMLTHLGHLVTRKILRLPYDASGAFRAYDLRKIPSELFNIVEASSYSFFFESLYVLNRNGFVISEVPIDLPARTYGHSKMSFRDIFRSLKTIFTVAYINLVRPEKYLVARPLLGLEPKLNDPQDWNSYWMQQKSKSGRVYEFVAAVYRRFIIRRNLDHYSTKTFKSGARLLHAGCGSGQVDVAMQYIYQVTGMDISVEAIRRYSQNNPRAESVCHGDIFHMKFNEESFDGIYNLGVMEHFTHEQIRSILTEFHRVLRNNGRLLLFWPHRWATSVAVLKLVRSWITFFGKKQVHFHPDEITYVTSRAFIKKLLASSGFKLLEYHFNYRDFFVQAVIIAVKES